ncbi:MAG: hypothetical protein JNM72_25070, partial [Deltaproteobacteria bacterium]|nr:hypothetical protein [Deltaproteobacteria bacterium]
LRTVRAADSAILQDLQDSRDHLGNVIEIDDEAQQTRWFDNAQVSPERTARSTGCRWPPTARWWAWPKRVCCPSRCSCCRTAAAARTMAQP